MEYNEQVLKRFCYEAQTETPYHTDFEPVYHWWAMGFKNEKGQLGGYAWYDYKVSGYPSEDTKVYKCGLLKDEYEYSSAFDRKIPEMACGVSIGFEPREAELFGDIPESLLIEKDAEGRITFCGMQENGLRHGLGTEFNWDAQFFLEFGLWQHGVLTHTACGGKLTPVEELKD